MHNVQHIDAQGTAEQKKQLYDLIFVKQATHLRDLLMNVINTILSKADVINAIRNIGVLAFQGAFPVVVFEVLKALKSGQASPAIIADSALRGAIFGCMDRLMNSSREGLFPKAQAAAATDITKNIMYGQTAISISGPLTAGILAAITDSINQVVTQAGGWKGILGSMWQGAEWEGELTAVPKGAVSPQTAVYSVIVDKMSSLIANPVVRSSVAAATAVAMEGAVMGALLSGLGIGYAGETVTSALSYGAMRGALEGVFNLAVYNKLDLGLIGQASSDIAARAVQKYMVTGTELSLVDIPLSILNSLAISATNQVVLKTGGWNKTMQSLLGSVGSIKWYNPVAPAKK